MARAKRTDRADVRRRYRAQLAADPAANDETPLEGAEADVTPTARGTVRPVPAGQRGRAAATTAATPGARPGGLAYGFRTAFRPAHFRDDLAHLPVILGSRWLWLSVALVAGTAVLLIATSGTDGISRLVAPYTLLPPPIVAIFITGFFAPRASYIGGAIVGLVSAIGLAAVITLNPASLGLVVPPNQGATPAASGAPTASGSASASASASPAASGSPSAAASSPSAAASAAASPSLSASGAGSPAASTAPAPSPSATPITEEVVQAAKSAFIRDGFLNSPLMGIFFASAAAWYRRFLALANPNRGPAGGNRGRAGNANRGRPQRRR